MAKCSRCQAIGWKEETSGLCCSGGTVSVQTLDELEEPLKSLLLNDSNK